VSANYSILDGVSFRMCRAFPRRRRGVSLLETIVTLLILAIIMTVVTGLFSNVVQQRQRYLNRLEQKAKIEDCLSRMLQEIAMMGDNGKLNIEQDAQGWQIASHLTIEYRNSAGDQSNLMRVIEWVSVPRYEQQDLVLFRREKNQGSDEDASFIPLCDGLYSFDVRMIHEELEAEATRAADVQGELAETDPNAADGDPNDLLPVPAKLQPVVEILAEMYQFEYGDTEHIMTFRRTFCLKRF